MIGAKGGEHTGMQNVNIQLSSSIRHPEQDEETHELHLTGQCIRKAGRFYLKYQEVQNGNTIQTTIKMGDEDAIIMRSGAVNMRLPFQMEGERQGIYGNGPAAFELIIKTEHLEFTGSASDGRFSVSYDLLAEGSLLGKYKLTITYSEGTS